MINAVLRLEPVGYRARAPAQGRPLGRCVYSPRDKFWAPCGAYAAGLQRWGGRCAAREVCAAPARACSTPAACNAPLGAKRFPKTTVFLICSFGKDLICSFCKDLKPRSIKLHFHSWRSFSWLVIICGSCLGKGARPTAACWGCWGTAAEAGWCSQQLLCK